MSEKERKRMVVMANVKAGRMSVRQAAESLGLSYRQAKRVWRRYRAEGEAGLVHRLRGKPGHRRKPAALRARILARYAERYNDFGPTLAAEYLAQEGLHVDHETLRRWLLAGNYRTKRRRREPHRQWRERKPCFGAMVQLDGSHHDWFEGRRPPCVLMVMVDDATNRVWAQFFEAETTHASYDMVEGWARAYGLPQSLYVDRDSIYRCEGVGSIEEQLAGKEPQTQFGRAMEKLGVELILANSPQAKGRVERVNGVLQDRLVKALRLAGISDVESANAFLAQKYLPDHNQRFEFMPASQADVHRAAPRQLDEILSWEEERVVQRDWTVACGGKRYQLGKQKEAMSLAGKRVVVRRLRDGRVQLVRGGVKLRWHELPPRAVRVAAPAVRSERKDLGRTKPGADHPWRKLWKLWKFGIGRGKEGERAAGVEDSGSPPLRSGLPESSQRHGNQEQHQGDIIS